MATHCASSSSLETALRETRANPKPTIIKNLATPRHLHAANTALQNAPHHQHANLSLDVTPLHHRRVPAKVAHNASLIRPAVLELPLPRAIDLLRSGFDARGFHAYARHLPIDALPGLRDAIPPHVPPLLNRIEAANVWIGDGGMASNVHYDGYDNLLLQLAGTKTIHLWRPDARRALGYTPLAERRFVFDAATRAFSGHAATGRRAVENHALYDALGGGSDGADDQVDVRVLWPVPSPMRCTLRPGDALLLPALWSHAVESAVRAGPSDVVGGGGAAMAEEMVVDDDAGADEQAVESTLNLAANFWFTTDCASHEVALRAQPDWAEGHFCHANNLRDLGRAAEAEVAYLRAVRSRPGYFDAQHNLAALYADPTAATHDLDKALAGFEAALALEPADVRCLVNFGVSLRRRGRVSDAIATYERARALAPADDARLLGLLGNAYAIAGRLADAAAALEAAAHADPTDAKALNSLGVVLQQLARPDEAVAAYRAALVLDPGFGKAAANLRDLVTPAAAAHIDEL